MLLLYHFADEETGLETVRNKTSGLCPESWQSPLVLFQSLNCPSTLCPAAYTRWSNESRCSLSSKWKKWGNCHCHPSEELRGWGCRQVGAMLLLSREWAWSAGNGASRNLRQVMPFASLLSIFCHFSELEFFWTVLDLLTKVWKLYRVPMYKPIVSFTYYCCFFFIFSFVLWVLTHYYLLNLLG